MLSRSIPSIPGVDPSRQDACSSVEPKDGALVIGVTYFLSTLLSLVLRNLVGRRFLMLLSSLGMALAQGSLGAYFHLLSLRPYSSCSSSHNLTSSLQLGSSWDPARLSWLPLPILVTFTASYSLGLGSLTRLLATELLPARCLGLGLSLAGLASNLCWFLVTKTFRHIQHSLGHAAPFFCYSGFSLLCLVFVYFFLPETGGKPAEVAGDSLGGQEKPGGQGGQGGQEKPGGQGGQGRQEGPRYKL